MLHWTFTGTAPRIVLYSDSDAQEPTHEPEHSPTHRRNSRRGFDRHHHYAALEKEEDRRRILDSGGLLLEVQHFVERTLAIALQVQRHVLETERLEDRREAL